MSRMWLVKVMPPRISSAGTRTATQHVNGGDQLDPNESKDQRIGYYVALNAEKLWKLLRNQENVKRFQWNYTKLME